MTRVNVDVDPDDIPVNPSRNRHFQDVLSRRSLLKAGTVVGAAGFLGGTAMSGGAAVAAAGKPLLGFKAVPTSSADAVVVPDGYSSQVLIPWGTPIHSGGPAFKKDGSNTAAEQAQQIGAHHDGMHLFPISDKHGLLALNHEYIDTTLHYADGSAVMTREKVDKALAGHGVSIVKVRDRRGTWIVEDSKYNRRVHGATPVAFSGPVKADHPELRSNNAPLGTLNNCSSGATPWGTYVTCEENWNGYFGTDDPTWAATAEQKRYGVAAAGFGYGWHKADPRFDLVKNPKELNRFGWCVEIDPFDPKSTPVKRTALGRIKHEGATFAEASDGRVVVYTGDDQDGEYIYKYVSAERWKNSAKKGRSPLDDGTLYVAKFNDDGSGSWIPLVFGQGALTAAGGWKDQADVLIRTRTAADAQGATRLDRPEWIAVHPETGEVYATLTNGVGNGGKVNPRKPNPYGHIIRWNESGHDNGALTFTWDVFLLAGDPAYDPAAAALGADDIFGSPDGLGFDGDGRLWIETDISNTSQNLASKGYDHIGNCALLASDPATREIKRFLTIPRGAEVTGVTFTPDFKAMFVNIQHPGEASTAWGAPTPADPRAVSNWPDFDPDGRPRSATVVITKNDGGKIGT
ncbi:PhoX family phosphatase [Actinocorallia longicatena]|uniref:PhoX family phosphatase n=1 Tax=Actinocorallia longicatena TaxID=111803 RepID=A0ABP6QKN8_9ACTN